MIVTRVVSTADVAHCPRHALLPGHFRDDGSCLCVSPVSHQPITPACANAVGWLTRQLRTEDRLAETRQLVGQLIAKLTPAEAIVFAELEHALRHEREDGV